MFKKLFKATAVAAAFSLATASTVYGFDSTDTFSEKDVVNFNTQKVCVSENSLDNTLFINDAIDNRLLFSADFVSKKNLVADKDGLCLRSAPSVRSEILTVLEDGAEIDIVGESTFSDWSIVDYNGQRGFVAKKYLREVPIAIAPTETVWSGDKLNPVAGVVIGPNGKESYYNLDMSGVVSIMRSMGFSEEEYPYWEREDGCKMLGNYIMIAADLNVYPRGSVVICSLGQALVCDTGDFTFNGSGVVFDIAVNW
jgi:hypothetical protein